MSNINYINWLEIAITNTYFKDNICSVFRLVPISETETSMQNHKLLIQKKDNTVSFYSGGDSNRELADIYSDLSSIDTLYYQLILEDTLFPNYTLIPGISPVTTFFFTNKHSNSKLQLSNFVNKNDVISRKPRSFALDITNVTNVLIKYEGVDLAAWESSSLIETPNSGEELARIQRENPILFNINDSSNPNELSLLINWQKSGVYEIWMDNVKQESFFYSKDAFAENCFGIIQLNMKEIVNQTSIANYNLDFDARSVFWQYQIVNPDPRDVGVKINSVSMMEENPNSSTGQIEVFFHGPTDQPIAGGQTAQVFTSIKAKKLQQELINTPQLRLDIPDTAGHLQKMEIKLPNPSPENLKKQINEQNEESLCSSTIVYV